MEERKRSSDIWQNQSWQVQPRLISNTWLSFSTSFWFSFLLLKPSLCDLLILAWFSINNYLVILFLHSCNQKHPCLTFSNTRTCFFQQLACINKSSHNSRGNIYIQNTRKSLFCVTKAGFGRREGVRCAIDSEVLLLCFYGIVCLRLEGCLVLEGIVPLLVLLVS